MSRRRRLRLLRTGLMLVVLVGAALFGVSALTGHSASAHGRSASRPARAVVPGPSTSTTTTTTLAHRTTKPRKARSDALTCRSGLLDDPAITSYLHGLQDDVTAAVLDVGTGRMSCYRPTVTEDEASIAKVNILAALLHRQPDLTADEKAIATSMIEASNDTSANDLWTVLGEGPAEMSFDRKLGFTSTTPGSGILWGLTTTSAADQIRLLRAVALGNRLLTPASRAYELGLMENIEPGEDWGVSSGVSSTATVALKNGWLPLNSYSNWQINSIGWIHGDGRDYLVAILTSQNPSEGYGMDTIQDLSDLIWSGLAPKQ
jgi:beta-lactamase class A